MIYKIKITNTDDYVKGCFGIGDFEQKFLGFDRAKKALKELKTMRKDLSFILEIYQTKKEGLK